MWIASLKLSSVDCIQSPSSVPTESCYIASLHPCWFIGDLCDSDKDGDGISDDNDNCPYISNSGQEDTNGKSNK